MKVLSTSSAGDPVSPPAKDIVEGETHRMRVDTVITQELERQARREGTDTTRFLMHSMTQILYAFGRPTSSYVGNGYVRWYYRGREKKQFYLDFVDGRVSRFGF